MDAHFSCRPQLDPLKRNHSQRQTTVRNAKHFMTTPRKLNEREVTVRMIAEHAQKTPTGVTKALKLAGIEPRKHPGKRGLRVAASAACAFVLSQWPEVGPLKLPQ